MDVEHAGMPPGTSGATAASSGATAGSSGATASSSGATGSSSGATAGSSGATAGSSGATAGSSDSYPTCARCRNHRLKIRVKGHKRFCSYRDCKCAKCLIIAKSQKYTARQTSVWRALAQEEALRAKQGSQCLEEESVTVTHRVPPELDSRLMKRIRTFLDEFTPRIQATAPIALGTDSRLVEGSNNSLSAGGRTLSTAPGMDSRTLHENRDSLYTTHSSMGGTTQLTASTAPRMASRVMERSGYSFYTGGRTPLTAPATDSRIIEGSYSLSAGARTLSTAPERGFRTLDESSDSRYSTHSSTSGTTQPAASAASTMDSRVMEGSDYSLFTGGRTLLTAPFATLPIVPIATFPTAPIPTLPIAPIPALPIAPIPTLPTSPIASVAHAMDSREIDRSGNHFSTGSRTLLTDPVASAAPNTNYRA
jgi:hypothetical protein